MKTYPADADQFLFSFSYMFHNVKFKDRVVAFDKEHAVLKFKQSYPNVTDKPRVRNLGKVII